MIVVDLALEVDLQHSLLGRVDTHVVDGGIAFLGGTCVFNVEEQGGSLVVGIHLKQTLPGEDDVVGGYRHTVGPAGVLQVKLHGVLACGLVFLDLVFLDQVLCDLAVLVELEKRLKHKADHVCKSLIRVGAGGVQIVDIVCQIGGYVLALVIRVLIVATADKSKRSKQGCGTKKQGENTLHHDRGSSLCKASVVEE